MEAGVWYVNTFLNHFFHRIILTAAKDKQNHSTRTKTEEFLIQLFSHNKMKKLFYTFKSYISVVYVECLHWLQFAAYRKYTSRDLSTYTKGLK